MTQPAIQVHVLVDDAVRDDLPTDCTTAAVRAAVRAAAASQGYQLGEVGVRLATDAAIHEVNVRHLSHDYPTDVISFAYEADAGVLSGEMIVSVQTATANAASYDRSVTEELLLYVVHGTLHIAGLEDSDPESIAIMRSAEREALEALGVES